MFITIRNLPLYVKTNDVKKLLNEKCLISDVILGEIRRDVNTDTMMIKIGLADECDAAIVFRKLNGLLFNGQPLILEDSRKKTGPVPGELNPMQYQATTAMHMQSQATIALHMQTQQSMIPGYSAMEMMATGYYNTMQPQMNNPRPQINQPRPRMNQPRQQFNQQGSQYEGSRNPEPYKKAVVHQTVLDWDIPSREMVLKKTDPVWGVRVKKRFETTSSDYQLDNSSTNMSVAHHSRSGWDDRGFANQTGNKNYEPYETARYSEAYVDSYNTENYENYDQYDVNQGYNQGAAALDVPFNRPHEPVWEMNQSYDNYNNFQANNRKRTYSETRSNEFQSSHVNPSYQGQDYYESAFDPNEIEAGPDEVAAEFNDYDDDHLETTIEPDEVKGTQYLGFNKFRFSHKIPIDKFKAFENYMFRNLISKRFTIDIKAYHAMYLACRLIWKKMSAFLGINLRKYAYYLLNYIQLSIERSMGTKMYDRKVWRLKTFAAAFHKNYTYQSFFLEFKDWFENYEKLEFKETGQFIEIMRLPRPAANQLPPLKVRRVQTKSGKIIYESKPGSALKRAQAAYDQEYMARQVADVLSHCKPYKPGKQAFAPLKPAVIEKKPVSYGKTQVATPGKAGASAIAQNKPGAPTKPSATANAQNKPGATAKPGATTIAQTKPGATAKPGATTIAQSKLGATKTAQSKPGAIANVQNKSVVTAKVQNKPGASAIAQSKPSASFISPGPVDEDPKIIADTKAEMELVKKKADTILSIPIDITKSFVQFSQSNNNKSKCMQLDPEYDRAIRMEMQGIHETMWSCVSETTTLSGLKRRYSKYFKRSIAYRILDLHISRTAKITFAPGDKQPSLAACNEYFNARHARVLYLEGNGALVLFSTNETFKSMCDERDVQIDGCKIQEILPLDIAIDEPDYHSAIEDAIKTDQSEKIHELVFNKAFIHAKWYTKDGHKIPMPEEEWGRNKKVTAIKSNINTVKKAKDIAKEGDKESNLDKSDVNVKNPSHLAKTAKDITNNNGNDTINVLKEKDVHGVQVSNRQTPKSLKELSLKKLNPQTVEMEEIVSTEMQDELNRETKKNTAAEKTMNTEKEDNNTATEKNLNSQTKEKQNSKTLQKLYTEMGEFNTKTVKELNTNTEKDINTQSEKSTTEEGQTAADDDDMDAKIKEFLDDFEKVVTEDDEIFMKEEDLEDFQL